MLIKRNCEYCGKEFLAVPHRIKIGLSRFCCISHSKKNLSSKTILRMKEAQKHLYHKYCLGKKTYGKN